jgi:AcrR family transcriptional regulator
MGGAPRQKTRASWIEAGQQLLRESGARSLKLHALTRRLGVSTGSFYHHFEDFDDYLGALARHYCGAQFEANLREIEAAGSTPRGRLEAMVELVRAKRLSELATSMRAWARSDPRADAAVKRVDKALLAYQAECFEAMGFSESDAYLRAYLFLGLASVDIPPPRKAGARAALPERLLDVLCRR